ncbi:MAG: DUF1385 domain-containing protein, partial [Oscillospiraceae bacterium]
MDKKEILNIGGQALIEGIMMKGPEKYSIAIRTPNGEIDVQTWNNAPLKFKNIPILRGVVNFFGSLVTGYKSLMHSADLSLMEEEPSKFEIWLGKTFGKKGSDIITMAAGVLGGGLALVLFMILPTTITGIINWLLPLGGFKALVEGVLKLCIFLLYLWAVSKQSDIKRVFSYHGAEHKTIACYEAGEELTVENVKKHTRFHPRCGTSFIFIVLVVSIIIFSFVPWHSTFYRVLLKLVTLPLIVGISYEILRATGKYSNFCTKILAAPGLWFQRLTTNEPDEDMIEVAIASVKAILP